MMRMITKRRYMLVNFEGIHKTTIQIGTTHSDLSHSLLPEVATDYQRTHVILKFMN